MIGQQVNQFKILEKIGSGGMGEVYLAEDTRLDRKVALKFLPPHYSQDPDFKARFEHEAKATAALNHPNIITVHDLGEHEGRLYIAMEHVQGNTLEALIAKDSLTVDQAISVGQGPPGMEQAIKLAQQVCEGLRAAHDAGIVHRDIKPANILVTRDGRVKLLDFGLAKSRRATTTTQVGTTVGTIQYESPEQGRGADVDQRSDLFSLGVVLYEMITSQRPFKGEFEDAVRYAIANESSEPLARYKSDVPDELQRIVAKLLEKDPELRYQSAAGVLSDLRTLQRDSGSHASSVHSAVQSSVRQTPQKRGLGRVLIPASVVVVILALLFVFKPWSVDIQPTQEASAAEDKLAVMYFENLADPEDSQNQGSIVANLLISDFSESEYIKVVSNQRLYDILKNLGREGERHITPDVATQVAQKANAKWMVTGTIMQSEPTFAISAQLVEVSTGDILASPTVRGRPGQDIFDVVDQLTVGIRKDLALPAAARDEADPSVRTLTSASPEAYGLYLEGLDLQRQYRYLDAQDQYRQAIELDSTYAMASFRLGQLRAGQFQDLFGGIQLMRTAQQFAQNANEWERLLMTATADWFEGRPAQAETAFKELIRKYPEEKDGYQFLSTFYRRAEGYKDEQKAIDLQMRMLELDSLDKEVYNQLAYSYDAVGNYEKSIWAINRYIDLNPGLPNPIDSRAELYANNGQVEKSLDSYLEAVAIDSNFVSAYIGAFSMYTYLERYSEAEHLVANMVSQINEDLSDLGSELNGRLALYRGHFRDALEVFDVMDRSASNLTEESRFFVRLAAASEIYGYLGDHDRSLRAVSKLNDLALRMDTAMGMPDYVLGFEIEQAINQGDSRRVDSLASEQRARFAVRGNPVPQSEQGRAALFLGNTDSALAHFELWAGDNRDFEHLYWLGQTYVRAERLRDGVNAYERAIERYDQSRWDKPIESTRIHFLLAQAYEKSGRTDKAREQYQEFLSLWKDADTQVDDIKYAKRRLTQLGA
jgi:serine/threonine protein kinase/TolA-binding protein